ncbi:MAG: signal recognition particle protein [Simkaniaceae bacterium]
MFGSLSEKFQNVFSSLRQKKLTEENISSAVRQVRLALLDADVNYSVASRFVKSIKEKTLGDEVLKSVAPGDQFVKIVHDELIALMGKEEPKVLLHGQPSVIMLCGLQGSGKTTTAAKLANYLKRKEMKKKPLLIAADLQRPAAVEQLKILGEKISVEVFSIEGEARAPVVVEKGMKEAVKGGYDVVIVDTAGRLHIDEKLMEELSSIKKIARPHEVLFVASAATGQDAVTTAHEFDKKIAITGTVLTMLDSAARAGAAISILEVTKKPLKFEGIGEKIEEFQIFNPTSMADRILGMGDVINLVRKAEDHINEEEGKKLEKKLKTASFSFEDYLKQMSMIKKMGSFKSLFKMMPGFSNLKDIDVSDDEFKKIEAIILSMTLEERRGDEELSPPRRRRVAKGSGCSIDDVNRLVKGFKRIKQMMKKMPGMKKKLKKMGLGKDFPLDDLSNL